jgi:cytochrome b involved in lipid metabolism
MMRKLFIVSTLAFWLAVVGFWVTGLWFPAETSGGEAVAAEPVWALAELARHDKAEDCWMAIDGAVFDFSAYLPQHPSKPDVILPWCGKEATEAYRTKTKGRPHSAYADQLLPQYRIGKLDRP